MMKPAIVEGGLMTMERDHWPMLREETEPPWLSRFRLEQLDPDRFDARLRHVDVCDGLALSYLTFGGPVELELRPMIKTYLAVIPMRGEVRLVAPGTDVRATTERAAVVDPVDGHWQVWSAEAEVLFVHVHIRRVSGVTGNRRRARLRPVLDLATPAGRKWLDSLMSLVRRADDLADLPPAGEPPLDVLARADELTRALLRLQSVN
ncbi:cupin domain-containing protein [Amycolatopsis jejuensis]|uniref:cupin domain-containing protein n=1 Tax=Amycolatopsis jejuensis TaxID=330084 RepID=UPI00138E2A56|nr:hypothetical protein [Amycolatopsis jejuensis]